MTNKNTSLDKQKATETAFVHGLSHDGRGIATIQHITTFIAGSLPNETVTYQIKCRKSHYHEAEVVDIIHAAPERAAPACPHFGVCGGCSLQHISDAMQIQLKERTLLDQLKHFGRVEPEEILPPLHGGAYHYRRKARLGVKFVIKKNKVLIGFREKSSRYLADLTECHTLHQKISARLPDLSQLIASLSIYQQIPQIEAAMGDTEAALIFRHMAPFSSEDLQKLKHFGQTYDFHIYLQPNSPLPLSKLWPEDDTLRLRYSLPDQQLTFLFHPIDFTQINLGMNRQMINQALRLLELQAGERVLDLFCGIGNFTLPLALQCAHVTGIEGGHDMVARGRENAHHNGIAHVDFHAANLEEPPAHAAWLDAHYDKLVLDPPRTGAKKILPCVAKLAPKRILYISCNPATLARDAGELVHQYHYVLKKVGMMNMFPHTSHIEAMALFDKP